MKRIHTNYGEVHESDLDGRADVVEAIISGILMIAGVCAVVAAISLLTVEYFF